MEKTCEFMELEEETVRAMKGITSGESVNHLGKHEGIHFGIQIFDDREAFSNIY